MQKLAVSLQLAPPPPLYTIAEILLLQGLLAAYGVWASSSTEGPDGAGSLRRFLRAVASEHILATRSTNS